MFEVLFHNKAQKAYDKKGFIKELRRKK